MRTLHGGLSVTRLGPRGAVGITALLFALLHFPTDPWRFLDVLSSGVILGLARHYTGSSVTGMIPHVLGNLKVLAVIGIRTA